KLVGSSAEYHFQQGAILAADGELTQAATELEKALSLDRDHNGALFELAYINDLFGNDDAAVDLYKRCTERPPVPLAAWITLGDLTRTTEAALLSSKNFGETSLSEIKEMMQSKGVRLGMALEGGDHAGATHDHRIEPPQEVPPEMQALLNKPISELSLSVRARKCMSKLNIQSVADLVKRSGDELLECKNFGVTSLNEVRDKLTTLGLKLKND